MLARRSRLIAPGILVCWISDLWRGVEIARAHTEAGLEDSAAGAIASLSTMSSFLDAKFQFFPARPTRAGWYGSFPQLTKTMTTGFWLLSPIMAPPNTQAFEADISKRKWKETCRPIIRGHTFSDGESA